MHALDVLFIILGKSFGDPIFTYWQPNLNQLPRELSRLVIAALDALMLVEGELLVA